MAILQEKPDLAQWYAKNVAVGAGHFVLEVDRLEDLTTVMKEKLIREVSREPLLAMARP